MHFAAISLLLAAQGKGGLGRERYVREREARVKSQDSQRVSEFRQRKLDKFSERRVEADLRKSQRACEQLDTAKAHVGWRLDKRYYGTLITAQGLDVPERSWFWPPELVYVEDDDEGEETETEEGEEEVEEKEEDATDVSLSISRQARI